MNYPDLNSTVKYVRQDYETKEMVKGEGTVNAVFLDPSNRVLVAVKDGDSKYNVDLNAINPDDEFAENYKTMLDEVKEVSKEGNDKSRAIVDEYNARVESLYSQILGAPLED